MKRNLPKTTPPCDVNPAHGRYSPDRAGMIVATVLSGVILSGCFSPPARGRLGTAPAKGDDPTKPGLQMGAPWTGWDDAREQAFRFADVPVFKVPDGDTLENAPSSFSHARPTARWTFTPRPDARMVAVPPVELRGPFDSIELWAGLDCAVEPNGSSSVHVDLLARDARGRLQEWPMGELRPGEWSILHHRLPWGTAETADFPFRLEAVRLRASNDATQEPSPAAPARGVLCLEHLTVYVEDAAPMVPAWRADPNQFQSPMEIAIHGGRTYWSEDESLYPVGSDARVTLVREKGGIWRWECRVNERGWAYRLDPSRWWSEGVELCEETGKEWIPRGRWRGLDLPDAEVRAVRPEGESLHLSRADGWSADIRMHRGALVVDLARESREPLTLRAGGFDATGRAFRLSLPWFNDRQQGPPLALLMPKETTAAPWVASVWFDPRHSSASALDFMDQPSAQPVGWLTARYVAGPDGRAPAVRERLVLNATPRLPEALPYLRPLSKAWRGPKIWLSPDPAMAEIQRAELKAQRWPADAVVEPAYISNPKPELPDEMDRLVMVREFVRRTPDGQWARSPTGAPLIKWPCLAFAHDPASGADASAIAYAWAGRPAASAVDYDPRSVLDAGRYSGPYEAVARWMDHARAASLAVAPADGAWKYSGRAEVAWCADEDVPRVAKRPEFALLGLSGAMIPAVPIATDVHPGRSLLALMGAPALGSMTGRVDIARSAVLAYELIAALRPLPRQRIGYYAADDLLLFPEAILRGDGAADHVYVEFEGPVEMCLNLSDARDWSAHLGGRPWVLPPGGWVVDGAEIQAAVARSAAGRLEFIRTPSRLFWNSDAGAQWEGFESNSPFLATALEGDQGWSIQMLQAGPNRIIHLPLPPGATGATAISDLVGHGPLSVKEKSGRVMIQIPDDVNAFEVRWVRP